MFLVVFDRVVLMYCDVQVRTMRGDCSALDSETLSDFFSLSFFFYLFRISINLFSIQISQRHQLFASAFAAVSTFLASAFTSLATFSTVLVLFSTFSASCFVSSLIAVALLVVGLFHRLRCGLRLLLLVRVLQVVLG